MIGIGPSSRSITTIGDYLPGTFIIKDLPFISPVWLPTKPKDYDQPFPDEVPDENLWLVHLESVTLLAFM